MGEFGEVCVDKNDRPFTIVMTDFLERNTKLNINFTSITK